MADQAYFHTATADQLMAERNYPPEIVEFLDREQRLLTELAPSVDLLIETACNDGRYLTFAARHGLRYLGIDLVPRHVDAGNRRIAEYGLPTERFGFTVGDISRLTDVIDVTSLPVPRRRCVVVFPFSIFSAIRDPARVKRRRPYVATITGDVGTKAW
jgi:hypothetical protein